ncbi:MAG TPA: C39 family peptidase [Vicinamibacterales bacterium]|nr:C39 family peptidase [Vicinamibacterales bacterium]
MTRTACLAAAVLTTVAALASAQPSAPVRFLDVPFIQQSEALCGGAAAAMVMRYWGATGVDAESFAPLVDAAAGGIRAADLLEDLRRRGWQAQSFRGDAALVQGRLAKGQPLVMLIEDRPGAFHFVVVVAWTNGRVVYHDPARAPFRVVGEAAFEAAWQKADRWAMLALPPDRDGAAPAAVEPREPEPTAYGPCDALVAEGVRTAGAGERDAALSLFASAADLCPGASAPLREAAGLHALAGNWRQAGADARRALARNRGDSHAWRILATSEYVLGNREAALEAWNAVGEPQVDLVTVQGLARTRHAVASSLVGLRSGQQLTLRALDAAGRRLRELPSADVARVHYTPAGGGRAHVEAVVVERPAMPATRASLVSMGLRALTDRELTASAASLAGGGEAWTATWRWWRERPRLAVSFAAPSRAGVWRADVYGEKQTYGPAGAALVESRRGGAVTLANWTSRMLRWEAGLGIDAWGGRGRTASVGGALEQALSREHLSVFVDGEALAGAFRAWRSGAGIAWRSRGRHEGVVLLGLTGIELASASSPRALWPGAGTGHARTPLLRAHPLLDDGRITGEVFGRRLVHGSLEVQRWSRPVLKVVRVAPAMFVDGARAERRLAPGGAWHVDAGVGLRLTAAGGSVLRLDVGKGLRDGATAISLGWTPARASGR